MWEPSIVGLVVLTFLCAGFMKGVIGLGLPIVTLALLGPTLGVREALSVFLLPGIIANAWQALAGPYFRPLMRRLWSFELTVCLGTWAGVAVTAGAKNETLLLILGAVLCLYCTVTLFKVQLPPPGRREPWVSPIMGSLGGMMFGMTGMMIVPSVLYLQTLGMNRHMFVQSMGITFCLVTIALGASLTERSVLTTDLALLSDIAVREGT